jgi:hypothetical protein
MPKAIISREIPTRKTLSDDTGGLPLTPGSSNTTPLRQDAKTPDWAVVDVQEFVPRRAQDSQVVSGRFRLHVSSSD